MAFDLDKLQKAVSFHLDMRHAAFADVPYPLYSYKEKHGEKERLVKGPMVKHLTIERHLWLIWAGNRLIRGGLTEETTDHAIFQFIYLISPKAKAWNEKRFQRWCKKHKHLDRDRCAKGIQSFIDEMFVCSQAFKYNPVQKDSLPLVSTFNKAEAIYKDLEDSHFAAHYEHMFFRACGWSKEKTFRTPYPELFLKEWEIIKENDSDKAKWLESDTYVDAMLRGMKKNGT